MSIARLAFASLGSAALTAAATAGLFAAWVRRMAPPVLHYMPTEENLAIIRAVPLLMRSYVPHLAAWNAHLAGFFGYVKLPGRRAAAVERIMLPDGGTMSVEWSSEPVNGRPVVVLLPGINNDASTPYLQHLMGLVEEEGIAHAASVNWRGLGGLPLTGTTCTPKPYAAAAVADVEAILAHLHAKLPASPLFGIGWSMGGGMLMRHMGDAGDSCLLQGGLAVSPSVDPKTNLGILSSSIVGKLYMYVVLLPLTAYLFRHRRQLASGPTPIHFVTDVLSCFGSARGFDHHLYAPVWGLGSSEAYWDRAAACKVIDRIRKPLLVVHAADDPLCPLRGLPLAAMAANPHIITAITRHGGHMGTTAGVSPLRHTWSDRLFVHYVRHLLARGAASTDAGAPRSAASRADGGGKPLPIFATNSRL